MNNEFIEDVRNTISNLGNEDGVSLEVTIDNKSLSKLAFIGVLIVFGGVAMNHLLKNI